MEQLGLSPLLVGMYLGNTPLYKYPWNIAWKNIEAKHPYSMA